MAITNHRLVPIAEAHFAGFYECIDEVARERMYLAMLEAPPREQSLEFVRAMLRTNAPAFVALVDDVLVGWCDVSQKPRATLAHRGRGVGKALMQATLAAARERGYTRVELTVRADNARAKRLYESCGFAVEGLCRNYMLIDGKYYDSYLMANLFD